MTRLTILLAVALATVSLASPASAEVLFRDDFSETASNYNQTVQNNASLSGSVVGLMTQTDPTYITTGTIGAEGSGVAQVRNNGTDAAAASINYNFANNADVIDNGFTVTLEGLTVGAQWGALMVFDSGTLNDQNVTDADLPLGMLFRGSGGTQLFEFGNAVSGPSGVFPAGQTIDVLYEITNISGLGANESFDFRVLVDGAVVESGSRSNVNTAVNYITFESWRTNAVTIDAIEVATIEAPIPEPASLVLFGLGGLIGLVALRRRRR